MADGTRKPITEIRDGDRVLTKDGPLRARGVRSSGVRRVGRLTLANGMAVRCTPDHPIFTQRGWVDAGDLTPNDFVRVARELPCGHESVPPRLPALLGYALSEGSLGYDSHFYLYSTNPDELDDMRRTLEAFDNTVARTERRRDGRAPSVRPARVDRSRPSGAVVFLFGACGLQGKGALQKRVPASVDRWNVETVAILVAKLFQGDGCIHAKTKSIFYATSSRGLSEDVQRLLLKLGIPSTVHTKHFKYRGGLRIGYTVNLLGGRNTYARFQTLVGPHLVGTKPAALTALVASYHSTKKLMARGSVDIVPAALYREPLCEATLKRFPSLKAGCRTLGVSYRLLFSDSRKRGMRRDTL